MGAISKLIKAGLKHVKKTKPKMDMKKYQKGTANRAADTRAKQLSSLQKKRTAASSKTEKDKLTNQIEHLKELQKKHGPKYKKYLTTDPIQRNKFETSSKAFNLIKAGVNKLKGKK